MDTEAQATEADIREKITDLIVDFGWRVDHGLAATIHELVTDDIEMILTVGTILGKDAVRSWGADRDAVDRRSSHLMMNFRFPTVTSNRVEAHSNGLIFRHSGRDSIAPALPWAVTEYQDIFVRLQGEWKFQSRFAQDIFMSDDG